MSDLHRRDPVDVLTDPRVDPEQFRVFESSDGVPLLVAGCVHDHPASVFRVRALVESLRPDAVGVELPGLAVPLFERVGRESEREPGRGDVGGEMSAALAAGAAVGAERAGIDTMDGRFVRALAREIRTESPSRETIGRVLGSVCTVGRHALSCRVSAALGRFGSTTPVAERAYDHDVDRSAPAAVLAADERRQLTRSRSVLGALERPVANEVVDAAREETMVANLVDLVDSQSVVAVVGFDHLSGITDRLEARFERRREVDLETLGRLRW